MLVVSEEGEEASSDILNLSRLELELVVHLEVLWRADVGFYNARSSSTLR